MEQSSSAIAVLADSLASSFARRRAAEEIIADPDRHPGGLEALLTALAGEDQFLHRSLLEVAATWDHPQIRAHLGHCLQHPDGQTRRLAIEMLGRHGQPEDIPRLQPLVASGDFMLSMTARRSVEALRSRFPDAPVLDAPEPAAEPAPTPSADPVAATPAVAPPAQDPGHNIFPSMPDPERPPPVTPAASPPATPPRSMAADWSMARRHQAFFGGRLTEAQALHETLEDLRQQLPGLEADRSRARLDLEQGHADHNHDLATAQQTLQKAEAERDRQLKAQELCAQALQAQEQGQRSLGGKIATLFSSSSEQQRNSDIRQLELDLKDGEQALERCRQAVQQAQDRVATLTTTLADLQQRVTTTEQAYEQTRQQANERYQALLDLILDHLRQAPDPSLLLNGLRSIDPQDADLAEHCVLHLSNDCTELTRLEGQEQTCIDRLEAAEQAANLALRTLGSALGAGFQYQEQSQTVSVPVTVTIAFKEERTLFSFSNASGSASGSGTVKGTVSSQEIDWQPPPGFDDHSSQLQSTWQALGRIRAERDHVSKQILLIQARLRQQADTIRHILDRDWQPTRIGP